MITFVLLSLAIAVCQVQAKSVWAHFMVSNTRGYSVANWQAEMTLARDAKLDGFALNMGWNETTSIDSLANAFKAANALGNFKLFFSLDYAGNGPWPQKEASAFINKWKSDAAYFKYNGKPLVSTFEGPNQSEDWKKIKPETGCFFIPSFSSYGAKKAMDTGVVDGLFSWGAWTEGPNDNFNTVDESYKAFLGGKPYMMPVSPWFFTNMPGFRKNWLWRGDDLWYDRWISVLTLQPEFVQIISWNDYGESHYIGPAPQLDSGYEAFDKLRGDPPFNYAKDVPHNGWRLFLPYLISLYKTGTASVTREGVVAWYRQTEASACPSGDTTGNTATQLQFTHSPGDLARDRIFFDALLGSSATVSVTIGGKAVAANWEELNTPAGGVGIYHGSVSFKGLSGSVVITISRGGTTVVQLTGQPILSKCPNAVQNWNPYVGLKEAAGTIAAVSPPKDSTTKCVQGRGLGYYESLCKAACKYNYCPSVCTCTALREKTDAYPKSTGIKGCPYPGFDETFLGLCSMTCDIGECSTTSCSVVKSTYTCPVIPVTAPRVPNCVAGTARGPYKAMCEWTCKYGECPPDICMCTGVGYGTPTIPPKTAVTGKPISGLDYGLCDWACSRGFCDTTVCQRSSPVALPSTGLTKDSTCKDMERMGTSQNSLPVREWWISTNTSTYLDNWFMGKSPTNWFADFAGPTGAGSLGKCNIDSDCSLPNCNNLNTEVQDAAGSAAQLQIMMSMVNFQQTLKLLKKALDLAQSQFAATDAAVLTSIWKSDNPLTTEDKQWYNGINAGVSFLGAVGGPAGGASAAFTSGLLTGVQLGLDQPIEFKDLADLQIAFNATLQQYRSNLTKAHADFISTGVHNGVRIQDHLAGGAYLDYRDIPILNTDSSKRRMSAEDAAAMVYRAIMASVINGAWRRNGLILMSYPMNRDEFNSIWIGDERLRYWDPQDKRGYFFQSWKLYPRSGPSASDQVTSGWPLGFQDIGNYGGIQWQDPLVSSIAQWNMAGWTQQFDYRSPAFLTAYQDGGATLTQLAGVFNIPVCADAAKSLNEFKELIVDKGISYGPRGNGLPGSPIEMIYPGYCNCQKLSQKEGGKDVFFKDITLNPATWKICDYGKP